MTIPINPIPKAQISECHEWRDWFFKLYAYTTTVGSNAFNGLSFLGSNITSIVTRNHNDLTALQGGDSLNMYHLTLAQQATVVSLPTVTGLGVAGMTTALTVGVAGTATAPPLPVGYMVVSINGTAYKMPYYNV